MDGRDYTFGAPYARDKWNEIVPNLFMGGHTYVDPEHTMNRLAVKVRDEFGYVLTLCNMCTGLGPTLNVPQKMVALEDDELSQVEYDLANWAAGTVQAALEFRLKVLVRCHAGYNRSGLVVALVLMYQGWDPPDAIAWIREKRSPHALHNPFFVKYLEGRMAG